MNDLTLTILELKTKVEKLVALHQELKTNNEKIITENNKLKKQNEEQKSTIELLEQKNKESIQNNTNEQEKIITETKSKINELVQEIDDCIALLK